jgi:alginate O-acetyltransferase complex protein AlgI
MTPFVQMLVICTALFLIMKIAIAARSRLPPLRLAAFLLWPGMRPEVFADRADRDGSGPLALRGLIELTLGLGLVGAAAALRRHPLPATLLLLPGLSLVLHFGCFNLVAAGWRRAGFDTGPLFRAPLAAASLGDFWGRRWNLAFSEMTSTLVYRPLRAHRTTATLAAFLFSGLLHECAISLPVRAGFGLPTLYFLLQGLLLLAERRGLVLGRIGTLAALALPLPLLFHPPFVTRVLWPIVGLATP